MTVSTRAKQFQWLQVAQYKDRCWCQSSWKGASYCQKSIVVLWPFLPSLINVLTNWLTTSSLGTIGTWLLAGVDGAKGVTGVVDVVVVLMAAAVLMGEDADADAAAALAASNILVVLLAVLIPRIILGWKLRMTMWPF